MTLTPTQLAALSAGTSEAKLCVEIDATTPLRYCSPVDPVQVSGDWYEPRWMQGNFFDLSAPHSAKTAIQIDNRDKTISTAWYLDRFSGYEVSIHILLREPPSKTWVTAVSVIWKCERLDDLRDGSVRLRLHAAGGHRQRWGLYVGNNSMFPWAPTAGTTFQFGSGVVSTSPPASINPYAELYGTTSSVYWSLMDQQGQMAFDAGLDKPYWVSDATWESLE